MPGSIKKAHFLGKCYLCSGLSEEELKDIDRITHFRNYKKNELIFHEGQKAECFYLLCQGRVKVYKLSMDGKEQVLYIVHPGETFGEATIFERDTHPVDAQAMDDSKILIIDRKGFISLTRRNPELGLRMIGNLSRYLNYFIRLVEDLSLKEISLRLAEYLIEAMKERGISKGEHIEIELDIKKSDLASRLGTISETLSRTLKKFRDRGIIEVDGRKIIILKRDLLFKIAEGKKI
jgi:CRP/FNR family transcriptional regulator